jgi:lysozyme family protein
MKKNTNKFIFLIIGGMLFMKTNISLLAKKSIEKTIKLEGGYSNHINDSGGCTSMGITESVARANGYNGDMRDLSYEMAVEIYYNEYWKTLRLDDIYDEELSYMVYDCGVNCGIKTSARLLQKATNWAYKKDVLAEDGMIGKNTIEIVNEYKDVDRIKVLFEMLKIARYVEITEARDKNKAFIYGWSRRTVVYDAIKK